MDGPNFSFYVMIYAGASSSLKLHDSLTYKLPNLRQQHWRAVNGRTSGKAAVRSCRKADTGCHQSRAPEIGQGRTSDSAGR